MTDDPPTFTGTIQNADKTDKPDNMVLWRSVEKTDPAHTKPITGKSYKGTSPKPYWLIKRATEMFGPIGIGWGFTFTESTVQGAMIEPGFYEVLHLAKVEVWYIWGGRRGEVEHVGGTVLSGRRKTRDGVPGDIFTDDDAPKKSVTDALVKALSMIGFAGDIFIGLYDDSKYVNEVGREFREADRQTKVTQVQIEQLSGLIESSGADWKKFCEFFSLAQLSELPASRFNEAVTLLEGRTKRNAASKQESGVGA